MPTTALLTLRRFSAANAERHDMEYPENIEWDGKDWALVIADSVGAICRLTREWEDLDDEESGELYDEIGDAVVLLDQLCTEIGGSLDQVLARRFNDKSKDLGSGIMLPVRP